MEEEGNLGAGGSATAPNAGGEGTSASQPGTGESPVLRLCFSLILFLASLLPLLPRPSFNRYGGRGYRCWECC